MKTWKLIDTSLVLNTKYLKIRKDKVMLPNNQEKDWIYWDSPDSAMVIAMTPEKKLVMIRQYRYLVKDEVIEFPSGGLHKREKPEVGAKREFEEETGYTCGKLIKLGAFYETYGLLNRRIHIFFTKVDKKTSQNLDQGRKGFERIKIELMDFDQVVKLALENKIVAMGSSLAILLVKAKKIY